LGNFAPQTPLKTCIPSLGIPLQSLTKNEFLENLSCLITTSACPNLVFPKSPFHEQSSSDYESWQRRPHFEAQAQLRLMIRSTPAHKHLGWKMQPTVDANGRVTSKSRFTIHSLRDRFGTTAAEEWKYSELQLLDQGSWEDQQTVRSFYLGTTDDTLNSVKQIRGLKTI
jgi:hypothetical protein